MAAVGFYIFYIFSWFISLFPLRAMYVISDFFRFLVIHVIAYRKKIIYQNLRNSFPEKSEAEIKKIANTFYKHFCDILIETVKLLHISSKELDRRVKFNNTELFDDLYKAGKNVILVSGHYGNWTWMVRLPAKLKHKPTVIYKPFKNKYFDSFEKVNRERYGAITIPIEKAYRSLMDSYNKKELFLTWFLTDQRPPKPLQFWATFLNQDTPVFLGAEKIAAKVNATVVYMAMKKIKRGYYEVDFKILCDNAGELPRFAVTEIHTRELEKTIIKAPSYWLWSHNRWKYKKGVD